MNISEFAKLLDGREYGEEITSAEEKQAKELGYVVVFGYSDDNACLRGAIDEEVGCWEGIEIYLDKDGIFEGCEEHCKYSEIAREKCKKIEVLWDRGGYCWIYETDIPHATFDITEDDEPYCRGIVFELKSLEG